MCSKKQNAVLSYILDTYICIHKSMEKINTDGICYINISV